MDKVLAKESMQTRAEARARHRGSSPSPTLPFSSKELVAVADGLDCFLVLGERTKGLDRQTFRLAFGHVEDGEHGARQALLNLPLIWAVGGGHGGGHLDGSLSRYGVSAT